jgi:prophage antirepressor-like protein
MGRTQRAHFINEQNLYRLIMRSDKPIAEPFQDWVCGDVLPSIRKTGKYGLPQTFAEALRLAAEQQEKNRATAKGVARISA